MISKDKIHSLIAGKLSEGDYFVVSLDVTSANRIRLVVDSMSGITIEECVQFSRLIEHNLDREVEDFSLEVTSPGLSSSLLVKEQYKRNIGRELDIQLKSGSKLKGLVLSTNEEGVTLECEVKVKIDGSNRKQTVKQEQTINYTDIVSAFVIIKF
ncbi:MAG: ribosome assembly cofactor RimP [Bacteroidota bacterium]|nr:MAG: ribosome assembly cofactor RimP [Bacteroidota bacterium]